VYRIHIRSKRGSVLSREESSPIRVGDHRHDVVIDVVEERWDARVEIRHMPLLSMPLCPIHRILPIPLQYRIDKLSPSARHNSPDLLTHRYTHTERVPRTRTNPRSPNTDKNEAPPQFLIKLHLPQLSEIRDPILLHRLPRELIVIRHASDYGDVEVALEVG